MATSVVIVQDELVRQRETERGGALSASERSALASDSRTLLARLSDGDDPMRAFPRFQHSTSRKAGIIMGQSNTPGVTHKLLMLWDDDTREYVDNSDLVAL